MGTGVIVIGDEILLGKRRDAHIPAMIERLDARGMHLSWARLLGDDADLLRETLSDTMASGDSVLSFGGIGATPDDRTRECAAAAAGLPLQRHREAAALIESRFGAEAYPYRILMADLPAGAQLVPNPVNQIPGFSLGDHHFLPGFPNMAWPMAEWVLDTYYAHLRPSRPETERSVRVYGTAESDLVPLMHALLERFPGLRLSSLPSATERSLIELGIRGDASTVESAFGELLTRLDAMGVRRLSD